MQTRYRVAVLYVLITSVLSVLLFPLMLLWERGRARLKERYGFWNLRDQEVIWFHGASVGELNGLRPLIKLVKSKKPEVKVLVTSVSVSGIRAIEGAVDLVRLLPFDAPYAVRRAIGGLKIKGFIFGETELWPTLFSELSARSVPVFLVNARVAEKSLIFYRWLRIIAGDFWLAIGRVLAGSRPDAERLGQIGAPNVQVTGNMKYDYLPESKVISSAELFLADKPVLIFGSLRPGEEGAAIEAIRYCQESGADFNVVIAPRHKERFQFFFDAFSAAGMQLSRRSEGVAKSSVLLLDSFGELASLYPSCKVAFIGGTLVNIGGHNPIEAARFGVPVIVGPFVQNIAELVVEMRVANAIVQVASADQLGAALLGGLRGELAGIGIAGREFSEQLRGCTERVFNLLSPAL